MDSIEFETNMLDMLGENPNQTETWRELNTLIPYITSAIDSYIFKGEMRCKTVRWVTKAGYMTWVEDGKVMRKKLAGGWKQSDGGVTQWTCGKWKEVEFILLSTEIVTAFKMSIFSIFIGQF